MTTADWGSAGLQQVPVVGRDNERLQLHAAYGSAVAGHGALVMVVGEPGIGKTALCEQLARHVAGAGGLALVGNERSPSVEHLKSAVEELQDMGMLPALRRATELIDDVDIGQEAGGLTPREREVADLVANGLSNRQIADAMVITEGTAEVHIKHILSKLGFKSRSQLAVWSNERRVK